MDVAVEELEIPYIEEVTALADDISAMYFSEKKRRLYLGEDESKIDAVEAIYSENDVDEETRLNTIIRLGHLLSKRAEEIAGITVERILANEDKYHFQDYDIAEKARLDLSNARQDLDAHNGSFEASEAIREGDATAYFAKRDEMKAQIKILEAEYRTLSQNIHRLSYHPETEKELDRLSEGYKAAIAEVREVGGDMMWNNAGKTPVVKMFDSAAQVYPADWISYSNQRLHPFARNLKTRAHYSHHYQKVVKRVQEDHVLIRRFPDDVTPEDTLTMTWSLASTQEASDRFDPQEGMTVWKGQNWEVAQYGYKRKKDGSGEPAGAGWKKITWQGAEGELTGWRRKEKITRRDEQETIGAPEIITNLNPDGDNKRRTGFATAVHELAHRFEATVPEVLLMEEDFYSIRTRNKETGEQNPKFNMTGKSNSSGRQPDAEYAREGGFISKYMGREYPYTDAYEILSTGTEALFGYNYGALIGMGKSAKDEHMRSFILGVLASAGKRHV